MVPDLSYILHALIGTSPDNAFSIVKTFGLLLVIAILSAAYVLYRELLRKEEEGLLKPVKEKVVKGRPATPFELGSNALLGFILGFKGVYAILNFTDFQLDPAGVILSTTGHWLGGIVGAVLFAFLKYWEKNQEKLDPPVVQEISIYPHDRIGDMTILAAIFGILGAKIFAIVEDLDLLAEGKITISQFIDQFFSGSGMAVYGGMILGFITVYIYLKRKKIPPIHVMDAVAPALILAQGIGRLGCHFSGDGDWGIPNPATRPGWLSWTPDWLWAYDYPHNVINEGSRMADCAYRYCHKLDVPVYPTSVYEFFICTAIFGMLWALRKRVKVPGMLFFIYLIFNGMERFWIEKVRVNERHDFLGMQMTQAEGIAMTLSIIGVIGCIILWQRSKKNTARKA
ncbi:MAG: prolipoprotein diacylglyceryl transferase family protein [Bacteroidota bacterium]